MTENLKLNEVLAAVDTGERDIWAMLNEDQQKALKKDFWNLNRYISSVKGKNRELQEHYLLTVNEFYNKHWAVLQKHPQLIWQLICLCCHESKQVMFHEYIALKRQKNKKEEFLAELYPNMKRADIETLAIITTEKEIKEYCATLGWDKKEINAIKL
jgi:hypothetical protein